ncbi:MAG: carbamoyltransferase HypF [Planctomycetaceae bacterium]|nr:carbamoyltransferase HypF [Planctomycetaceae bacterium]
MSDPDHISLSVELSGFVQGLGIRPLVVRLARCAKVAGSVGNDPAGVRIDVQGRADAVQSFLDELRVSLSPGSLVRKCSDNRQMVIQTPFGIRASVVDRPCDVPMPRDIVLCDSCRSEILSHTDRRWHHPFNSCATCGPRYSLMVALPWDRERSTMKSFAMCGVCQHEYESADDRRFHAQTISCPACGPKLSLYQPPNPNHQFEQQEILNQAVRILRRGSILAIKGIGGFQLLCDATQQHAVEELRRRKRRISKPFAVMLHDASVLSRELTSQEQTALNSPENPIVILDRSHFPHQAASVTCGMTSLGVMLPPTALHWLLSLEAAVPLVVTSANQESEPILFNDHDPDCLEQLTRLSDAILTHDREILQPIDDSVIRVTHPGQVTLRAARGCTPWPLSLTSGCEYPTELSEQEHQALPRILALGANQKVSLAVCNGHQMALLPHLGDISTTSSRIRFEQNIRRTLHLYQFEPQIIAHDLHPDFYTTNWASKESAANPSIQTIAVQHHHAHIAATMLEHRLDNQVVLGIAFDGSGYGPDGTIWGGEFLRTTMTGFERLACLRPFPLVGGEHAIREPWRVAVALLVDAMPELTLSELRDLLTLSKQQDAQLDIVFGLLKSHAQSTALEPLPGILHTTSMGRLFDGVASLILKCHSVSFEGEAAMRLEDCAMQLVERSVDESQLTGWSIPVTKSTLDAAVLRCDWRPMIRAMVKAIRKQTAPSLLSTMFHESIATLVAKMALLFPDYPVVVGGGCFQNAVLMQRMKDHFAGIERPLYFPERIPVNDGGISAGQLAVAFAQTLARPSPELAGARSTSP